MNYNEALSYIHGTYKFGAKNGLENIRILLSLMGDPHKKLKFVHVAGTNGKGSISTFINNILISSGYKTALYTSPFLIRFNERYRVNNFEISDEALIEATSFVKEKAEVMVSQGYNHPTEFEIVTAIGFKYFADMNCDFVVLEVGLGGRLDATNVISHPEVAVITSIDYDHTSILGNEISQIAFEKAGIIKSDCQVVLYPQTHTEAESVISDICRINNATLYKVDPSNATLNFYDEYVQIFDYKNFSKLKISLLGKHQIYNAATAIEAVNILQKSGYNITEENIIEGLINSKWPGRFEVLTHDPLFIIDGAHNAEGANALSDTIKTYFPEYNAIVILGLLKDKDADLILSHIFKISTKIITVKAFSDRALSAEELANIIKERNNNITVIPATSYEDAVLQAKKLSQFTTMPLTIACGSLYYIGEIKKIVLGLI